MGYRYLFRPDVLSVARSDEGGFGDHDVYVFDDEAVVLAVNIALATARPLLVRGAPGSGKSTLAPNVARVMQRRYLELVVTSRTEPDDLLWRFDAVRRLSDAHLGQVEQLGSYYRPGVLWKAFESDGAQAVVLIDEIDKADPDLPNSLLAPLGTYSFPAPDGRTVVAPEGSEPLVVITSNDERHLPRPFLRRCVVVSLRPASREHLLQVARAHFGSAHDSELSGAVADAVFAARDQAATTDGPVPSTAEFLDTLRACQRLGIDTASPEWEQLADASLFKPSNSSP